MADSHSPGGTRGPLTVVVADSHVRAAEAISRLLDAQPGFSVVGVARDRAAAARLLRQHCPSVLLLDVGILGRGSLNQVPLLQQASPGTRVLLMGMNDAPAWGAEASRLGTAGYLRKDAPLENWVSALRGAPRADG